MIEREVLKKEKYNLDRRVLLLLICIGAVICNVSQIANNIPTKFMLIVSLTENSDFNLY